MSLPFGRGRFRDSIQPLKRLDPFKSRGDKFFGYLFTSVDFEQSPAKRYFAVIEQPGSRCQVVEVAESVSGHQVELGAFEELTLNSNNLLNRLIVWLVVDRPKIKVSPLREQRIGRSQGRMMNSQKALEFFPTILKRQ